jgi:hypothetical protein
MKHHEPKPKENETPIYDEEQNYDGC